MGLVDELAKNASGPGRRRVVAQNLHAFPLWRNLPPWGPAMRTAYADHQVTCLKKPLTNLYVSPDWNFLRLKFSWVERALASRGRYRRTLRELLTSWRRPRRCDSSTSRLRTPRRIWSPSNSIRGSPRAPSPDEPMQLVGCSRWPWASDARRPRPACRNRRASEQGDGPRAGRLGSPARPRNSGGLRQTVRRASGTGGAGVSRDGRTRPRGRRAEQTRKDLATG